MEYNNNFQAGNSDWHCLLKMLESNALKRMILANFKFLSDQNRKTEKKSYPPFLNLNSLQLQRIIDTRADSNSSVQSSLMSDILWVTLYLLFLLHLLLLISIFNLSLLGKWNENIQKIGNWEDLGDHTGKLNIQPVVQLKNRFISSLTQEYHYLFVYYILSVQFNSFFIRFISSLTSEQVYQQLN